MSTSENQASPVPNLPVMVHAQYVKDISFENPSAPFSLKPGQDNPKLDVSINLDVRGLEDPQQAHAFFEGRYVQDAAESMTAKCALPNVKE